MPIGNAGLYYGGGYYGGWRGPLGRQNMTYALLGGRPLHRRFVRDYAYFPYGYGGHGVFANAYYRGYRRGRCRAW